MTTCCIGAACGAAAGLRLARMLLPGHQSHHRLHRPSRPCHQEAPPAHSHSGVASRLPNLCFEELALTFLLLGAGALCASRVVVL